MTASDGIRTPDDTIADFVRNGGVRLRVLDSARADPARGGGVAGDGGPAPVLVVPGMGEYADEYAWLADRLGDRRVVVADVRGRGGSDVPETGYTWEDHIGDLRAVVTSLGLDRPILVAFSRGSSYALGYALDHPEGVRGLVVGDYAARHVGLPEDLAERQLAVKVRGVPVARRMSEHAVRRVFAESREVPLWERLTELRCPVLALRGGARGAVLTDELAERWRTSLPSVALATLPAAGHDLWSRDPEAYLAVLLPFLTRCDTH
ncbi:alpha/beta hydrolase [Yinghuangia sp. ASG 101]|uniref:alpha/beta fold hydrolase n=1 Tax=Yinghuangia sp. ASG 101 TaxID=2896848 RepID=UPI001E370E7A|nr:alpha/beta hydrolase [Yinghuangia sp. ASG 101]UGQ11890.1 alpha/beta hydrolase [Yinghuangia sp. ASG 101]